MMIDEGTINKLMTSRFDDYDPRFNSYYDGNGVEHVSTTILSDSGWSARLINNAAIPNPFPIRLLNVDSKTGDVWEISTNAQRNAMSKWAAFTRVHGQVNRVVWSDNVLQLL
jgi:hypothetical protein